MEFKMSAKEQMKKLDKGWFPVYRVNINQFFCTLEYIFPYTGKFISKLHRKILIAYVYN